ncbi:MAG: DUF4291 domain-containing protein [Prochloraceae cyanobacterium]
MTQKERWPKTGRHILAQYDDNIIVVYQAYRAAIGHFAASHGYFGGEFRLNRMSWIKPNFLWMMYRSGWGSKPGQEVILAVSIKREAFDQILAAAVHSSYVSEVYNTENEWKIAVKSSSVRLQWDPDRTPRGGKLERRAIQLGLQGEFLRHYARDWIVSIEDISLFVQKQYNCVKVGNWKNLLTPKECIYPVANSETVRRLKLSVP